MDTHTNTHSHATTYMCMCVCQIHTCVCVRMYTFIWCCDGELVWGISVGGVVLDRGVWWGVKLWKGGNPDVAECCSVLL